MQNTEFNVLDTILKPKGFEFDLNEAFRKLATSQFGGNPGRGFCELIQNGFDSYPSTVPREQRRIEISRSENMLGIRDFGEGMSVERINLLATLGGTDKQGSEDKIGKFGIGFFAIFNPNLKTAKVTVRTRCGSRIVLLQFIVDDSDPTRVPALRAEFSRQDPEGWQGTDVEVRFRSADIVDLCLGEAQKFTRYFPCPVWLDGKPMGSNIWEEAHRKGARFFEDSRSHGFLEPDPYRNNIFILCRYEPVLELPLAGLVSGNRHDATTLEGLRTRSVPYVPDIKTIINDNHLNVTVSRDGVRTDADYWAMLRSVTEVHMGELRSRLSGKSGPRLALGNQFVFADQIHCCLNSSKAAKSYAYHEIVAALADFPNYRLAGQADPVSLRHIWNKRSPRLPVFFSPRGLSSTWLGGAFEHDFIVIPPEPENLPWVPGMHDKLFSAVFKDVVNLDTIEQDPERIQALASRGIVPPDLLAPKCEIIGTLQTSAAERQFLTEIDQILTLPEVRRSVQEHLHLPTPPTRATLFVPRHQGLLVTTGLFESDGRIYRPESEPAEPSVPRREIVLGLMRTDPLVQRLVHSRDPHRACYAVSMLAHLLVGCQRMLAPGSSFRNWVTCELGRSLRNILADKILADQV